MHLWTVFHHLRVALNVEHGLVDPKRTCNEYHDPQDSDRISQISSVSFKLITFTSLWKIFDMVRFYIILHCIMLFNVILHHVIFTVIFLSNFHIVLVSYFNCWLDIRIFLLDYLLTICLTCELLIRLIIIVSLLLVVDFIKLSVELKWRTVSMMNWTL